QRHRPGSSGWCSGGRHRFLAYGTGIRPLAPSGRRSTCGVGRDAIDRVLDHERHGRRSLALTTVPSNVNPGGLPWTGSGYPVFGRLPPTQTTWKTGYADTTTP